MLTADINLSVLYDNISIITNKVRTEFCAVVKADAYGHGIKEISKAINEKVDEYAVASLKEACMLIESGITKPINVLGNIDAESHNESLSFIKDFKLKTGAMPDITLLITQKSDILFIKESQLCANIKINSGMNRLGVKPEFLGQILEETYKQDIDIKGVYTHFYNPNDVQAVKAQFEIYTDVLKKYNLFSKKKHLCASSCLFLDNAYHLDMVRCGIAMYGYSQYTKPVLEIHTDIMQIIDVKKGEYVSYGDYTAVKDSKVAIIRCGYADGLRRKIWPWDKRFVSIQNSLCEVVGQVCMDACMVDITDKNIDIDDKVYILGEKVSADFLAKNYNTIIYEVLTSFSSNRIKRNYIG